MNVTGSAAAPDPSAEVGGGRPGPERGIEAVLGVPGVGAHEHARGVAGVDRTVHVVLALVALVGLQPFDHGTAGRPAVADPDQSVVVGPGHRLGHQDRGAAIAVRARQQLGQAVGVGRAVVVHDPVPADRLTPIRCGGRHLRGGGGDRVHERAHEPGRIRVLRSSPGCRWGLRCKRQDRADVLTKDLRASVGGAARRPRPPRPPAAPGPAGRPASAEATHRPDWLRPGP